MGHANTKRKSPAQLQREIDAFLSGSSHATKAEITSTAGLMAVASAVARELKRSGVTWGDGRNVRVWNSGDSVRFEVPGRFAGHPSDAQAIVDLIATGPDRNITRVRPFAGDTHYDKRFGDAMEKHVQQVLKKGAY